MPGMTMAQLYKHMKGALSDLGLGFHDMAEVRVEVRGQFLQFEYNGKQVAIILPEAKK